MVKIGGAKRDEILTAYDQLQKAEANVIGACATFCEGTGSEYYYAYYNKDNQRVDPEKEARRARKKGGSGGTGPVSAPATPATPRGPRRQGQAGQHQSSPANQQRTTQTPQTNRAQRAAQQARTQQAQGSSQSSVNPVSTSQSWKKSAVAAGVQQARRSNTPRIDRSQGKRH